MIRPRLPLLLLLPLLALAACGDGERPALPEEEWIYGISMALFRPSADQPRAALERARVALRRMEAGEAFGEVAREVSDDEGSRADDGFLGFMNPTHETRFAGAIQVIRVGETRGPLWTQIGLQLIHRHSFEEARALERKFRIPAHGFLVSWREIPGGADRTEEEARKRADEAFAQITSGALTIPQAQLRFGDGPPEHATAYIGLVNRSPRSAFLYDALKPVPEKSFAPVTKTPMGYAVLFRAPHLRSIVRHVLVQHVAVVERAPSVRRSPAEAKALAEKALAEARPDGSNWSEVLTRYGDAGTDEDGTMGAIGNGELPPALEEVVMDTPPGRVASRVAESPAGFHVLWRVN